MDYIMNDEIATKVAEALGADIDLNDGERETYLRRYRHAAEDMGGIRPGGSDAGLVALYVAMGDADHGGSHADYAADAVRTALDDAGGVSLKDPRGALKAIYREGKASGTVTGAWWEEFHRERQRLHVRVSTLQRAVR